MLVVVFENEGKAYEGKKSLWALDAEGSISVYASSVVARNPDGSTEVKQEDPGLLGTLVGTPVGALIGLIGGPTGAAIGAAAGGGHGAALGAAIGGAAGVLGGVLTTPAPAYGYGYYPGPANYYGYYRY